MNDTNKILEFQVELNSIPVKLRQKDGGVIEWELREMIGTLRDRYMKLVGERFRYGPDGKPAGFKRYDGMELDMLQYCLFDDSGGLVKKERIQELPGRLITRLHEAASELNSMEKGQDVGKEPEEN